jgi:hypothetical protein
MTLARASLVVGAVVVAGVLGGCAGVPRSSSPDVVQPIGTATSAEGPSIQPFPGESARDIVTNFLLANSLDANQHTSALQFLTEGARNRWNDATATIVDDETIGVFRPDKPQVVVTGRIVGTLNANGIYVPSRQRIGNGGGRVKFTYGIKKVGGQYRIDQPSPGLLLTEEQFQEAYHRRSLYFFDLANRYLVPDVRWSALSGLPLDEWMINQLAIGPSPLLQNAVNNGNLPSQVSTQRRFIRAGSPLRVRIPGSSQLPAASRNRLAAQVGTTLNEATPGGLFEITDGDTPVRIPATSSDEFSSTDFSGPTDPPQLAPAVYYLRRGHIVDSHGRDVPGPANNGRLGSLTSLAVGKAAPSSQLAFAAVADSRLLIGSESAGLRKTRIRGNLSRPVYFPGMDEVWVADGSRIYRVTGSASAPSQTKISQVAVPSLGKGQRIVALSISPEGSRLAMVVSSPDGSNQLYIAAILRTPTQVRIDLPGAPISPEGVSVTDVAWIENVQLIAVGELSRGGEGRIFNTNVDGSFWSETATGNLPDKPDSVAVTQGNLVWVSANDTVWYQSGSQQWASPGSTGQTSGYAPTYVQ